MIAEQRSEAPMEGTWRPALLMLTGRTLGFVASFCIPVVLARVFDQAEFGTYKQLFLIVVTLYGVGQLGMAESLFYFLPLSPRDGARYVANSVLALVGGGMACLLALELGGGALSRGLSNPELSRYTTLVGLYLLLTLTSACIEIVMIARKRYRWASCSYAAQDLFRAAFLIIPALLLPNLTFLMWGAVGFAALRCATALAYLFWEYDGGLRPDGRLFRAQVAYAVPFQLAGVIEVVQSNLHQYVVAHHFDAATFAIYSVGCLQIPLVEFVVVSVVSVMMIRMTEELREGRRGAALIVWHDSIRQLALVFFPLVVVLLVTAHQIIDVLFTERYAASTPVFMVWSLAFLVSALAVDGVLRVHADTRFLFALNAGRLVLTILLIEALLSWLGLVGVVLATVLAAAAAKAMALMRIGALMQVSLAALLPWRGLSRILTAAATAGAPALAVKLVLEDVPWAALIASGAVYGVGYVVALCALGAVTAAERRAVSERLARWGVGSWITNITGGRVPAEGPLVRREGKTSCVESRE